MTVVNKIENTLERKLVGRYYYGVSAIMNFRKKKLLSRLASKSAASSLTEIVDRMVVRKM